MKQWILSRLKGKDNNRIAGVSQWKQRWQAAVSDDSGVAMIVVLIVGAVVMVFCLSLLLVTYTLFAQTSRQTTQLQCKLLAQSCSEMLGEEFKNPDSELSGYLSEQIENGSWISEDMMKGMEEGSLSPGTVSELTLNLGDEGALGDYNLTVTLTYSLNIAEDDGSGEEDEDDDQDNNLTDGTGEESGVPETNPGGSQAGGTGSEPGTAEAGNVTYSIKAFIRCMRGDGTDRDVQFYTIETIYPAVSL